MEETAIREVAEEVGLIFSNLKLFIEDKTEIRHIYRYLWDWQWEIRLQESECDGYAWYTYEETKNLLLAKNMQDLIEKLHTQAYI